MDSRKITVRYWGVALQPLVRLYEIAGSGYAESASIGSPIELQAD